jgi:hypothetical protein
VRYEKGIDRILLPTRGLGHEAGAVAQWPGGRRRRKGNARVCAERWQLAALLGCSRKQKEEEAAAEEVAKADRLRQMQERLAAWQAQQAAAKSDVGGQ